MSVRSFFGVFKVVGIVRTASFGCCSMAPRMHGGQRIRDDSTAAAGDRAGPSRCSTTSTAPPSRRPSMRCARGSQRPDALRGDRARRRHARLPRRARRHRDYYEIDPAMIRIARDPYAVQFSWQCRPDATITLGDARLTLAEAPDGELRSHHRRRVLVRRDPHPPADARSHGDVPEAKLAPHGMMVLHISNRHLELASVVAGIAAANGLDHLYRRQHRYRRSGQPVQICRHRRGDRAQRGGFRRARASRPSGSCTTPDPTQWVWTDDYSNIVGAVIRKLKRITGAPARFARLRATISFGHSHLNDDSPPHRRS